MSKTVFQINASYHASFVQDLGHKTIGSILYKCYSNVEGKRTIASAMAALSSFMTDIKQNRRSSADSHGDPRE
jgi:hypothetical protein